MKNKINKYSYTLFDVAKQYNMIDIFVEQLETIKQIYKKEATFRLLFESKRIDEKELESTQEKLQGEKEILDKTLDESKVELGSLNMERDDITKNISNNYLSHYNNLKNAMGLGLAPLNESCCGNCFSTRLGAILVVLLLK